jgi:hypothetical protein
VTARRAVRWEAAAFGLVAVVAAAVRLYDLGGPALAPAEAPSAAIAWSVARGERALDPADPAWSQASPLLTSAQLLTFGLLGGSGEAAARLPSALAGTALCLLPWLVRRRLGMRTALVLAAVIALDPLCVEAGRRADGAEMAAFLGAAVIAGLRRAWWGFAAAAAGLLLVAGAAAWTIAPVVALVCLLDRPSVGARVGPLAAVAGTAALLGASGFLAAWALVGGVSASLTSWLAAWSSADAFGSGPASWPGALLGDPLPFVLGGAGLLWLIRSRRLGAVAVIVASLGWTARLAVRPGGDPAALMLAVLILTAAVAPALEEIGDRLGRVTTRPPRWTLATGALLGALALPGLARTGRILAGPGSGPASAGPGLLAADVERLSWERAGDAHELPVEVVCQPRPDPALRWVLRGARYLSFHSGSFDPRGSDRALVVSPEAPPDAEPPCEAPPSRSGARYQVGRQVVVLWVPREP